MGADERDIDAAGDQRLQGGISTARLAAERRSDTLISIRETATAAIKNPANRTKTYRLTFKAAWESPPSQELLGLV